MACCIEVSVIVATQEVSQVDFAKRMSGHDARATQRSAPTMWRYGSLTLEGGLVLASIAMTLAKC